MTRNVRRDIAGSVDDLKSQLVLVNAEIRSAMERRARAEAMRESVARGTGMGESQRVKMRAKSEAEAARADEALATAKRRKIELEGMIRTMAAKVADERQQAASVAEQLRQQTAERLRAEKNRLQHEYLQSAGAMDDLKRAQTDAERHFQKERERLEAQIAQARAAMSVEAERIRVDVASAKRAATEKADKIRREQAIAERQLRERTEGRLLAERRKLEAEFAASKSTVQKANQDLNSAEHVRRESQRMANEIAAQLRAAEKNARRWGGASPMHKEASRRLGAAYRSAVNKATGGRTPSKLAPSKSRDSDSGTFDPSDTMIALRTELTSFENKVSAASEQIDAASRARAQAQRAQLLVEERLARQRALEEETRLNLYEEAETWLAEERQRDNSATAEERNRARAKAEAENVQREAKASKDLMLDIKSQLGESFDDEASSIEHSLRLREMEEQQATELPPDPALSTPDTGWAKDNDERRKAKEALDRARAREHVQRMKKRYNKD